LASTVHYISSSDGNEPTLKTEETVCPVATRLREYPWKAARPVGASDSLATATVRRTKFSTHWSPRMGPRVRDATRS
jgi:hypothetical protein